MALDMQVDLSEWLGRMVAKSSSDPHVRIINLFLVLQDWIEAPGMQAQFCDPGFRNNLQLQALINRLVSNCNYPFPERLGSQIGFLLFGALAEEMRNPGSEALARASEAVSILFEDAKPDRTKRTPYLAAVSFCVLAFLSIMALQLSVSSPSAPEQSAPFINQQNADASSVHPARLAALYHMHEKIKAGQCSYPQALMIAADRRAIYLNGVVNVDRLSTVAESFDEIAELYGTLSCSYAPAAMLL